MPHPLVLSYTSHILKSLPICTCVCSSAFPCTYSFACTCARPCDLCMTWPCARSCISAYRCIHMLITAPVSMMRLSMYLLQPNTCTILRKHDFLITHSTIDLHATKLSNAIDLNWYNSSTEQYHGHAPTLYPSPNSVTFIVNTNRPWPYFAIKGLYPGVIPYDMRALASVSLC